MKKNIVDIGYGHCRPTADEGAARKVWLAALRCLMILIGAVFFLAPGRGAIAATMELQNSFKALYNINDHLSVGFYCGGSALEVVGGGYWSITGDLVGAETPHDVMQGYSPSYKVTAYNLDSFARPGGKYFFAGACSGSFGEDPLTSSFEVRELAGKFGVSAGGRKITVSGVVDNGANLAGLKMDGKEVGKADLANNGFSFEVDAIPGTHEIEVFAGYGQHTKMIGRRSVTIDEPPAVDIRTLPKYTNDKWVKIDGKASAASGIARARYRWFPPADGMEAGAEGYLPAAGEKELPLTRSFKIDGEGVHQFRFWAQARDGQDTYSKTVETKIDKTAPKIEVLTDVEDGFIAADTQMLVRVTDFDGRGDEGAGIASVMMQVIDEKNGASAWMEMNRQGTEYDASYALPFSLLRAYEALTGGNVTVKIWAKDKAGNEVSAPSVVYKKANAPVAVLAAPAAVTNKEEIDLKITLNGAHKVSVAWMNVWKLNKDGSRGQSERVDFTFIANKTVARAHAFRFPHGDGRYAFQVLASMADGQTTDADTQESLEVLFDTTKPSIELLSPQAGSKHKTALDLQFKVEDKDSSGIEDVQLQVCKKGVDCNQWVENIPHDGKGVYTKKLPLDSLESGPLTLWVWAMDKADNRQWSYFDFEKELKAADAVGASLRFADANGGPATGPFYLNARRTLRVAVTPQARLEGMDIAFALPDGLSLAGSAVLNTALSADAAGVAAQLSQWKGRGMLLAGVAVEKDAPIVIDIPVEMSKALPSPKVRGDEQTIAVEIAGKNFAGAVRAEAVWRADWKKAPEDVSVSIAKSFDLSAPDDIAVLTDISGGYDTFEPAKWNRNTLHCAPGGQRCAARADGTDITLRFTEQTTHKTVDLVLQGQRRRTALSGQPAAPTALDAIDTTNTINADGGADAEARFSVSIPQRELARLPSGGVWRAHLAMEMRDHAGQRLAGVDSAVTLNVADASGMAMQRPHIELVPGSHRDNDGSAGFSVGDALTYRITYEAARDLQGVQLTYTLPEGLATDGNPFRHADASGFRPALGDDPQKGLLRQPVDMKKGQQLSIDVPLCLRPGGASRLTSRAHAIAAGFDAMASDQAVLDIQSSFDVSKFMALSLEMAGPPDAVGEITVAQQQQFIYRITLAAGEQPLKGASLDYRLPGGMQAAGKPVLKSHGAAASAARLNPQWDGNANVALLAADAVLPKSAGVVIDIPVMVKRIVDDGVVVQSTVSAGAVNLHGTLQKSHRIKVRERAAAGDRVRIAKSADSDAAAQPGAQIRYRIRVSNQTFKTVRNLLIRDRAPDHTTLVDASCGNLPAAACKTLRLGDKDVADGRMTHAALCTGAGPQPDPRGNHVFWCLNGDLAPLADYTVDYAVQIDSGVSVPDSASAPPP